MVKIHIQEKEYETDNMTDEQKGLVESIHQGQVTEEKLKARYCVVQSIHSKVLKQWEVHKRLD